ncbi:MAG: methyltransferase family protein [Candidatus Thorarchaeota archaeon]|jgi:protein-S-isoprenylcysteine O-methyltransferase Ste14
MLEYLPIILGVALFGLQHSGISSLRIKNWIIDKWGKPTYANLFSITSVITLAIAFLTVDISRWFYFFIAPEFIQPLYLVLGGVLMVIGLIVTMKAASVISVSTVADMRTDRKAELVTDGIYSRIRHPLYLATILLLLALIAIFPFLEVLVFSISLSTYTLIGAYIEERKLVLVYGNEYINYRKQAGFIFPRV